MRMGRLSWRIRRCSGKGVGRDAVVVGLAGWWNKAANGGFPPVFFPFLFFSIDRTFGIPFNPTWLPLHQSTNDHSTASSLSTSLSRTYDRGRSALASTTARISNTQTAPRGSIERGYKEGLFLGICLEDRVSLVLLEKSVLAQLYFLTSTSDRMGLLGRVEAHSVSRKHFAYAVVSRKKDCLFRAK